MVSTTSGTTSFSLDVDEIIEEALEPLGGEHQSGISSAKARRTLNLLLLELQNKNIPLHKIATESLTLVDTDADYTLDTDITDILQASVNDSADGGTFTTLDRWSLKQFDEIPDKTTEGRPTLYCVERLRDAIKVKFWPVPNSSTLSVSMLLAKRIEDITASYQKLDVPVRYLPLIVKWLSYELSLTRQGIPAALVAELKMRYEAAMPDTFEEDRERVDLTIIPGGISGF